MSDLDAMSANAAADELDRLADDAEQRGHELSPRELRLRAGDLRALAEQRLREQEEHLRAVAYTDRARNYGIGGPPDA